MAKETPQRRQIKFADFDSMLADIKKLQTKGYRTNGNWSLGQTCGHLADWMRFPMDGFPKMPMVMRPIFWLMKVTVAKGMKKRILAEGFKPGMPTSPSTVPDESVTDDEQVKFLQETIARLQAYKGPLLPSPLFGPMDKDALINVSLLHAEHHLGYLVSK